MEQTGTSVEPTPQIDEQAQQQAANKAELDSMMAIHLNGGRVPENQQQQATETPAATTAEATVAEPSLGIFQEKFGWQKAEDAIKEIEELRLLKTNPPPTPEYEFENEESKRAFLAFSKGDRKEALKIFAQQERIENLLSTDITKDTAAEIIKLNMHLEHPKLTQDQIEFQYRQDYGIPKEPVYNEIKETEEEFKEKHDAWKEQVSNIEMKAAIAATMAQPKLEAAKSKIVFPEIEQTVDDGYIQYRKMLEEQPKLDAEIRESYQKLTPKNLETKVKFTDEANKIDFEFQYEPDGGSFKKTIDVVSDFNKLIEIFTKPDGTPDREGFAKAMDFALNSNKIIMEAIKQSKNATLKSILPDNSGGAQRQFPQSQQPNEVDEMMRLHGIKRAS